MCVSAVNIDFFFSFISQQVNELVFSKKKKKKFTNSLKAEITIRHVASLHRLWVQVITKYFSNLFYSVSHLKVGGFGWVLVLVFSPTQDQFDLAGCFYLPQREHVLPSRPIQKNIRSKSPSGQT